MAIFVVDNNLCSKGCLEVSEHWMKLAKEKLISQGEQSTEFSKVPLLKFVMYFCNQQEGKLPPAVWERGKIVEYGDMIATRANTCLCLNVLRRTLTVLDPSVRSFIRPTGERGY